VSASCSSLALRSEGRAEALVPELGDAELELLDLKLERDAHRLGLRGFGEGGLRAPLGEGNLLG
jgi:hypothetical protein